MLLFGNRLEPHFSSRFVKVQVLERDLYASAIAVTVAV
jgi:hypothetical protein